MRFLNYSQWLKENMATLGDVPGMGNVVPPTPGSVGSGDAWPSLFQGKPRKKRRKKKK